MSAPVAASASPTIPQISAIASPAAATPAIPEPRQAEVPFVPALPSTAAAQAAVSPAAPAPAAPAAQVAIALAAPKPAAQVAIAPAVPAPAAPVGPPARPAAPVPGPGFDLAQLPQSRAASPAPAAPAPAPPAKPAARLSLDEVFRDLGKPSTSAAPVAGAVDISRITPAKTPAQPKPEPAKAAPPKPAPPSHPSRIWVQLGIGRDKAALAADWRRLSRQAANAFKSRRGYVSDIGQTNRMLAGPFDSAAQANKFLAELRTAGIDGPYIWTSPAGQVVDALPSR
jgi:hypothetical protein